jgi:pSer/pThr/pTyr-binding forkhead associated (FHA) protein
MNRIGPHLINITEGCPKQVIPLGKVSLLIGKEGAELQIPSDSVSDNHASIMRHEGRYYLRDNGSHNGSYINGERVDLRELKNQDIIRFGEYRFIFDLGGEPERKTPVAQPVTYESTMGIVPPSHRNTKYRQQYHLSPASSPNQETLMILTAEELKKITDRIRKPVIKP